MKKLWFEIMILLVVIIPINIFAKSGCCSHHGGVAGCNSNGRQICNDGTLSPTCTCTPSYVYGCTDKNAKNYNSRANKNDDSCIYYKYGCTDINALNYDVSAEKDDGSCVAIIYGCMDQNAKNYDKNANKDDGSCVYYVYGCTDETALNYNSEANTSDNSCQYKAEKLEEDNSSTDDDGNSVIGLGVLGVIGYFIFKKIKRK